VKALLLSLTAVAACAQDGIVLAPNDGRFQIDLRPSLEAVLWSGDTPAPALLGYDDDAFFAPRFALEVDAAAGEHFTFHSSTRWDRGFDAGSVPDGELRIDEAFARWQVCDDQGLNFQLGKYASFFGAWPGQHGFFDDPFLLAPLPYCQLIGVSLAAPGKPLNTGGPGGTALPLSTLSKDRWASMIWGAGYGIGGGAFGSTECFDYALEVKNAALSSHPDTWQEIDFSHPTVTARVGYRPDATLSLIHI
jgi:hypothetical protein